jgi:hypothetical protein
MPSFKTPKAKLVPSLSDATNKVFQSCNRRWFILISKAHPGHAQATSGQEWFRVSRQEAAALLQGKLG